MASSQPATGNLETPLERVEETDEEHVTSRPGCSSPEEALDSESVSESEYSTADEQTDSDAEDGDAVDQSEASCCGVTDANTASDGEVPGVSEQSDSTLPSDESSLLLDAEQLLDVLSKAAARPLDQVTIGFVGYPNVGKSSTLNALMGCKKTAVSQTPGRTKHLQTLHVRDNLILCDCPGLVMPSFVHSKADLIVAGILSIDEMRDCFHPIGIICQQIPRPVLEFMYGINLSQPKTDGLTSTQSEEEAQTPPTPCHLLTAHALSHGFRACKGNPHYDRSARLILKDYVQGRLLYCHPPPDMDAGAFQELGRETALLPPSLSHLDNASKRSRFLKMSADGVHLGTKPRGLPSKLVKDFDQLFFHEQMDSRQKPRISSHVRSNKRLLVSQEQLAQAVAAGEDVDETSSCLSSSSWTTVASSVGGSSLLSGTEYLEHSQAGSGVARKPWRIVSQSKGGATPLEAEGDRRTKKVKRKEKLRRVYAHLDRVVEEVY